MRGFLGRWPVQCRWPVRWCLRRSARTRSRSWRRFHGERTHRQHVVIVFRGHKHTPFLHNSTLQSYKLLDRSRYPSSAGIRHYLVTDPSLRAAGVARRAAQCCESMPWSLATFQSWFWVFGGGFSLTHTALVVVSGYFRVFQDSSGSVVSGHGHRTTQRSPAFAAPPPEAGVAMRISRPLRPKPASPGLT